jgi:N-dimethylarginine dimethylaminohydrolase
VAQQDLAEATRLLGAMLHKDSSAKPFMNTLIRARFQLWQQQGQDLLVEKAFSSIDISLEESDQACTSRVSRVRQAILRGDENAARSLTIELLSSGYFEPLFVRMCGELRLCPHTG